MTSLQNEMIQIDITLIWNEREWHVYVDIIDNGITAILHKMPSLQHGMIYM